MQVASKMLGTQPVVALAGPVHRVFIVDCSGSMYGSMAKLREHLKNKLAHLCAPGDRVSIIWFSSRGQYGILQEGFEVHSLADFAMLNTMIDRYLQPMALTGFKEPFDVVPSLIQRINAQAAMPAYLFFLTDGMDNQWRTSEIMQAVENAAACVEGSTVVEYGWYCNHNLLVEIAQELGASLLFAQDFAQYSPIMEMALTKRPKPSRRVEVSLPDAVRPWAFTMADGDIVTYQIQNGKVLVPETAGKVSYIQAAGTTGYATDEVYGAIYVASQRMDSELVWDLLRLGDVELIHMFATCFSKQDYAEFGALTLKQAFDAGERLRLGKNPNLVPADDCYTIIDLLDELAGDSENKFHPYDPAFKYERISRGRVQANAVLTDADKAGLIEAIRAAMTPDGLATVIELSTQLLSGKRVLKFVPNATNGGYAINALTFNEDRPNISIQIMIDGTVDLGAEAEAHGVPRIFPTHIVRNYAMVVDGIKHSSLDNLPMELSASTFTTLQALGFLNGQTWEAGRVYYLNAMVPVLNRSMVKAVSAQTFFAQAVTLLQLRAAQKVLKYYRELYFPRVSAGLEQAYGAEATAWLKEIGITDNGFAPKSVEAEPTDEYTAVAFELAIAKCSSLPAVTKVLDKLAGGKYTQSEALLVPTIQKVQDFMASAFYTSAADQTALLRTWLESETKAAVSKVRALTRAMAKTKFAIMVGHTWFTEFSSLDEGKLTVTVDGTPYDVEAKLKDVVIKI